jgi:integrase
VLILLLGLLGLRVSEACAVDINDLGMEHGHRVVLVHGKGGTRTLMPLPPAVARAVDQLAGDQATGRCCAPAPGHGWTGTPRPGSCAAAPGRQAYASTSTHTCCAMPS